MCASGALVSLQTACSEGAIRGSSVDGPLHFASLVDVAKLIESGDLSPVELTEIMLDRIERIDPRLKSYATVMTDHALGAARRAEAEIRSGSYRGPLHGIPIAVKDLVYTRGVRTMGGSAVRSRIRRHGRYEAERGGRHPPRQVEPDGGRDGGLPSRL